MQITNNTPMQGDKNITTSTSAFTGINTFLTESNLYNMTFNRYNVAINT